MLHQPGVTALYLHAFPPVVDSCAADMYLPLLCFLCAICCCFCAIGFTCRADHACCLQQVTNKPMSVLFHACIEGHDAAMHLGRRKIL
jgi:hypothetical protein